MYYFKRFSLLIFIFASTYALGRLYFNLTDGFSISNITSEFAYRSHWDEPKTSLEEKEIALKILDQNFHYLGRGAQAYAFLSDDGQYVLKLVKQKHLKLAKWEDLILKIPFFSEVRNGKIARRKAKVENVLESSRISFEDLRSETALVYLHLKETSDLGKQVKISDKLGFKHVIDLDRMEFVLQKRSDMALPYIEKLIKEGNRPQAEQAIADMIKLRIDISKRGIRDKDTGFLNNMGFIDGKPVIIDIGQFAKDDKIKLSEHYKRDIQRKTQVLRHWLNERDQHLVQSLESELETVD